MKLSISPKCDEMDLIELAKEKGLEPKRAASTKGGEYWSSCPDCGGDNRFHIWPNEEAENCVGKYWCRKCGKSGDAIQFCREFLGLAFKDAVAKVGASIQKRSNLPQVERSYIAPCLEPPEDYQKQRKEILKIYSKRNFLETTLDRLTGNLSP